MYIILFIFDEIIKESIDYLYAPNTCEVKFINIKQKSKKINYQPEVGPFPNTKLISPI